MGHERAYFVPKSIAIKPLQVGLRGPVFTSAQLHVVMHIVRTLYAGSENILLCPNARKKDGVARGS
jgi:hypothetical protein